MPQHENTFQIRRVNSKADSIQFEETWYRTWLDEGYATPTDDIQAKYAKYAPFSVDYLLLKTNDTASGTMRIVNQNNAVGLPVANDFTLQRSFHTSEKVCEATLLTVNEAERQHEASLLLLVELWRYVRTNNITGIAIAADFRLWIFLTKKLRLCFNQIGEQKIYEGSMTIPGLLNVEEQKCQAMKATPRNILERAFHTY